MSFQKGRLKTGGRKLGSPNNTTQVFGQFCRSVLETEQFQRKWHWYLTQTPIEQIEPKLLTLVFHYAYGRPREQIELSGVVSENSTKIIFYLPEKWQTP